jgi:succinoglycan biosynthesis protein ExoA
VSALPPLSRWPAVSVVVPARDCAETLEAAVQSALDQEFDGSIEVVLAVGPSGDETEEIARRISHDHPRIRYRANLDGSTPAALNLASATARGDVLVRLDAHAELPPGYVARALEVLRETGAGNVGGMQVPVGAEGVGEAIAAAMRSPLGSGGARYRVGGPPGDVDTVYLGNFRREALDAVGGFDESLVRNQDYELNHRLREAGLRVYFDPDLKVRYRPRESLGDLARQYFGYGAWKRHVARLHPSSVQPRQMLPPVFVLSVLASSLLAVVGPVWPLAGILVVYLAALVGGSVAVAGAKRVGLVPLIVAALATMHVSWGVGFLVGRRRAVPATSGTDDA